MLRRGSWGGVAAYATGIGLFFLPLVAASTSDRPRQTMTLLTLALAVAGFGVVWLVLRARGYVRGAHLLVAPLAGGFSAIWFINFIPELAAQPRAVLAARLAIVTLSGSLGLWLCAMGSRRIFPRRVRGIASAGIAVVLAGVWPGPMLLLQNTDAHHVTDIAVQVQAGLLYYMVGSALMVGPFLALATIPGDWFERWWARAADRAMAVPEKPFTLGVVLVGASLALVLSFYSFGASPTTADEIAQLWHARILLSGNLALPPDPDPEFFTIDNVIDRPVWMSQFPIGGPAVMAIGVMLGVPWLMNPLLSGLTALNIYRFAQRAYGEPQARAAAAVFIASPMAMLMGGTHMNHTPTVWLITLALASLAQWSVSDDFAQLRRTAAVIGFATGCAVAVRPLDGAMAAAAIGLFMLAVAGPGRNAALQRSRSLLIAIAAGALPVSLLLLANWSTTGHPFTFGYELLWGPSHSLGLHDDPTGRPHTAWRALILGLKYATQLNWVATVWPVPAFVIVAGGLALTRRPAPWDRLLLAFFAAQLIAYSFYWHDGQFIGPRFMFSALPALLILAARAPFLASQRLSGNWRRVALILLPVCIGVTWLRSMRPFGAQGLVSEFRESRSRLKLDPPRETALGERALIFVQEGASTRLLHRLWGMGVSRPDAARLLRDSDGCSLLEAIRIEERSAPGDTAGRVTRLERQVRPYRSSPARVRTSDPAFQISDSASLTPECRNELAHDLRILNTVAYGPMLLRNEIDDDGRISGPVVYALDLGERNEVLRERFADRRWWRYEASRQRGDSLPVLVPYDSAR